jgi:hypothetical protein
MQAVFKNIILSAGFKPTSIITGLHIHLNKIRQTLGNEHDILTGARFPLDKTN